MNQSLPKYSIASDGFVVCVVLHYCTITLSCIILHSELVGPESSIVSEIVVCAKHGTYHTFVHRFVGCLPELSLDLGSFFAETARAI
jgi:hypothetical protein